jgi:hypothetical protein
LKTLRQSHVIRTGAMPVAIGRRGPEANHGIVMAHEWNFSAGCQCPASLIGSPNFFPLGLCCAAPKFFGANIHSRKCRQPILGLYVMRYSRLHRGAALITDDFLLPSARGAQIFCDWISTSAGATEISDFQQQYHCLVFR